MHRKDILEQEENIRKWIIEKQSKAFICKQLQCKPSTLNTYLQKMDISYSGNKGMQGFPSGKKLSALEMIHRGNAKSHKLKLRLIEDGIKEHKCEKCGLEIWLGEPVPLELHHKDGDRFNNNLENIKLLCPNCHAMEPNNSGKAKRGIPAEITERGDMNGCIHSTRPHWVNG